MAKAFNEPLVMHPVLVDLCTQYYETTDQNYPGMKLAKVNCMTKSLTKFYHISL